MSINQYCQGLKSGQLIQVEAKIRELESTLKWAKLEKEKLERELKELKEEKPEVSVDFEKKEIKVSEEALDVPPTLSGDTEILEKLASLISCYPEFSTEWIQCTNWVYPKDENGNTIGNAYEYIELNVMNEDNEEEFDKTVIYPANLIRTFKEFGTQLEANYGTSDDWDLELTDLFMQYHFYGRAVYG
jgi:chromosome segregation ATPase